MLTRKQRKTRRTELASVTRRRERRRENAAKAYAVVRKEMARHLSQNGWSLTENTWSRPNWKVERGEGIYKTNSLVQAFRVQKKIERLMAGLPVDDRI